MYRVFQKTRTITHEEQGRLRHGYHNRYKILLRVFFFEKLLGNFLKFAVNLPGVSRQPLQWLIVIHTLQGASVNSDR